MEVIVHRIADDGLPNMDDDDMVGRVAFIWDGCIVSGWPLIPSEDDVGIQKYHIAKHHEEGNTLWEADSDVGRTAVQFANVTHWVEFPVPLHSIGS